MYKPSQSFYIRSVISDTIPLWHFLYLREPSDNLYPSSTLSIRAIIQNASFPHVRVIWENWRKGPGRFCSWITSAAGRDPPHMRSSHKTFYKESNIHTQQTLLLFKYGAGHVTDVTVIITIHNPPPLSKKVRHAEATYPQFTVAERERHISEM